MDHFLQDAVNVHFDRKIVRRRSRSRSCDRDNCPSKKGSSNRSDSRSRQDYSKKDDYKTSSDNYSRQDTNYSRTKSSKDNDPQSRNPNSITSSQSYVEKVKLFVHIVVVDIILLGYVHSWHTQIIIRIKVFASWTRKLIDCIISLIIQILLV